MFTGMTSAETVGWFSIIVLIAAPALILLVLWSASRWPGYDREREPYSPVEVGTAADYAYREPADPSYVDRLMTVRATAPVFHNPSPLPVDNPAAPAERPRVPSPVSPYRVTLADLVEGSRYVLPAPVSPALPPALTVPHYASGIVHSPAHAEHVGAHRARDLVAA